MRLVRRTVLSWERWLDWTPLIQMSLPSFLNPEEQEHCLLVQSRTVQAAQSEATRGWGVLPRKGPRVGPGTETDLSG